MNCIFDFRFLIVDLKAGRAHFLTLLLALAGALAACSKQQAPENTSNGASGAQAAKFDPATAASISGVVHFAGASPKPRPIDMSGDPDCSGKNEDESLVLHDGRLANVVVYVKDGLPKGGYAAVMLTGGSDDAPDPRSGIIRQKNCRYVPHVVAILAGSRIVVYNDDATTHNVHPVPRANREWNASQTPGVEAIVKTFEHPELMIPLKCNVHPWMKAYINVMQNPFYAVTRDDGSFDIEGLPPGTYTIAAVHENLGEQTTQIMVGPKEKKHAEFNFPAAANAAAGAK